MPRVARFKIAALDDLHRQLRFTPDETRLKQMNATEALIEDLDLRQNYPEDFVVFRITGYRARTKEAPAMLVGEALVPDLTTLVQCLSRSLDLPCEFEGRRPYLLRDTAKRLNISTKTVQRYRKQGLVCHYVVYPDGVKRLVCFEDSIDRFVTRNEPRLHRASKFSRIEETVEQRMIREAATMHAKRDLSLNEAAMRLAERYGRAHETVRLILKRHDQRAEQPIFDERGPLTPRDLRVICRAWRFGVPAATLARRFGKGSPAIHRAINRRRRDLLTALQLEHVELPTFALDGAVSVILAAPAANSGLDDLLPADDALKLIKAAGGATLPEESLEDALVAAYNLLKKRARVAIDTLPDAPNSRLLDEIETHLRWATFIKRRLLSASLPGAIGVIEQSINQPLPRQPADEILKFLRLGAEVASRSIEGLDPMHRHQRLERVVSYAVGRALATLAPAQPLRRASARHAAGTLPMRSIYSIATPWQPWLAFPHAWLKWTSTLDETDRKVIELRHGGAGGRPHSIAELATILDSTEQRVTRLVLRLEAALRAASREAAARQETDRPIAGAKNQKE